MKRKRYKIYFSKETNGNDTINGSGVVAIMIRGILGTE